MLDLLTLILAIAVGALATKVFLMNQPPPVTTVPRLHSEVIQKTVKAEAKTKAKAARGVSFTQEGSDDDNVKPSPKPRRSLKDQR